MHKAVERERERDTWVSHERGGDQTLARSWQDLRQNLAHRESEALRVEFSRSAAERAAELAQRSEASNLGPPNAKELDHSRAYRIRLKLQRRLTGQ